MESRNIIPKDESKKIDQNIDGWKDIDLVRRLQNHFAHSSGKYNPSKNEHIKTMEVLGVYLNINIDGRYDFPLMIDTEGAPSLKVVESMLKLNAHNPAVHWTAIVMV